MLGGPVLWLLVLVPILLQIPLLLFLMRNMEVDEAPERAPGDVWGEDAYDDWEQAGAAPSEVTRCRNCGAENDPGYQFCGNCTSRL
ncbi:MAG: zinc ribbon domain-containing protein [Halolamina sp.]